MQTVSANWGGSGSKTSACNGLLSLQAGNTSGKEHSYWITNWRGYSPMAATLPVFCTLHNFEGMLLLPVFPL